MENTVFVNAETVARELGISKAFAYKLMQEMNKELRSKGYMTIAGKVSRKYFLEKFYGLDEIRGGDEVACI